MMTAHSNEHAFCCCCPRRCFCCCSIKWELFSCCFFFLFSLYVFFEVCQFMKKAISSLSIPENIHIHIHTLDLSPSMCTCLHLRETVPWVFCVKCYRGKMITNGMYMRIDQARSKSKERIMQKNGTNGREDEKKNINNKLKRS